VTRPPRGGPPRPPPTRARGERPPAPPPPPRPPPPPPRPPRRPPAPPRAPLPPPPPAPAVPADTPLPTATLLRTPEPAPTPIPDPLASARTVLTTAPIAIGDDTLAPGAPLEIPLDTPLADGAVPSGTTVRLPGGQVLTLPAGIPIPAVENPTTVGQALTTILQRTSAVGDTTYAPGTAILLRPGTSALGSPEPNAT